LSPLLLTHCAHTEASRENPDALFAEAEESFQDERYLIAIEKFRDIKNRFPYSTRAVDAELRIADCYFEQESFLEAASSYEIFLELHPTHPKIDYVQYRVAMSYFNQIPDNSARDLSAAYKAIEEFQTLLDKFPSSSYSEKGKEFISEARKRLAEHESYVADFYFQRKHYLSASYRYAALLQEYPNFGYDEEALYRLGTSYFNTRMFGNARDAFTRLIKQFPESGSSKSAQGILEDMTKRN
jgi:outer membrane protein assembly factor BamD